MALLGTIRNRFGWVMMGLIFVGIFAFLFMDISPGGNTPSGNSRSVGSVNGDKISSELVRQYSADYQGGQYITEEINQYVWDRIIDEKIVAQRTSEAGMAVSPLEMGDMFVSADPRLLSSTVKQYFGDRQRGGMVNTADLKQRIDAFHSSATLAQIQDAEQKDQYLKQRDAWFSLEKTVKQNRLREKYVNSLRKSIYTPNWMVEMEQKTQETAYNFDYVRIPYVNIKEEVKVSDQEIKDYIAAHPREYKREATANLSYVLFDVLPTAQDTADYIAEMTEIANDFRDNTTTLEDSTTVEINYGSFPADYFKKSQLSEPLGMADSIFAAADGTVFGPYLHNGKYRVVKKIAEKVLPDSVKTRHILIPVQGQGQQGQIERQNATVLLDSIKNVLLTDPTASFDSMAVAFSKDGSASQGGDLGWRAKDGGFVPQFEEYMFFTGVEDSLEIVYTQFGVHLLQITGYKFENNEVGVRIASVEKDIIPSVKTTEDKQREVLEFITTNRTIDELKAAAKENSMTLSSATGLEAKGFDISGVGRNSTSADLINWAHDPETGIGEVTNRPYSIENEILNCTDKFVVAALTARAPKGLASITDSKVKADVDRILRNEKKTALVKQKLATLTSLDAIAGEYGLPKETATGVTYGSANITAATFEPKVAGLAAATAVGQMSTAVGGKEGIYVVNVTSVTDPKPIDNLESARTRLTSRTASVISGGILQAEKDAADIEDNRSQY